LTISSQDVTLVGVEFSSNTPATNQVTWAIAVGGGAIIYNNGNSSGSLSSGNYYSIWTSGALYIYWDKDVGSTSFQASTSVPTGANQKILAIYRGGANLDVLYGTTIIDGNKIKTGTITASNIASSTITATQIASDTITADKIAVGTITADRIKSGEITTDVLSVNTRSKMVETFSKTPVASGYTDLYSSGTAMVYALQTNDGLIGNDAVLITFS
jgi:hypothetical protein